MGRRTILTITTPLHRCLRRSDRQDRWRGARAMGSIRSEPAKPPAIWGLLVQEAYIQGVSTRAVDDLVKAMGGSGISKSEVSRLVEEIDGRVNAFLNRPLEGEWPYVWIDATYVKAREGGRIVSTATIIAVGVNTDGRREVLGVATGASEAEVFWKGFLRSLADRGLRGVKLV